jgi:hypothetical protein
MHSAKQSQTRTKMPLGREMRLPAVHLFFITLRGWILLIFALKRMR